MKKQEGYQVREQQHFDHLTDTIGDTYWANKTPAGIARFHRKAHLAAQRLAALDDPFVLELGCGTGVFTEMILDELPALRLLGCDISPVAIRVATERCARFTNARFEAIDAITTSYPESTFDAVIGLAILHHLPLDRVVPMCYRVLKPGGIIWFTEPNMLNPQIAVEKNLHFIGKHLQNTEDETAFFRWPLARTLRSAGFQNVTVAPFDFLYPLIPRPFIGLFDRLGRIVEQVPVVREIAGNLLIGAIKPQSEPVKAES